MAAFTQLGGGLEPGQNLAANVEEDPNNGTVFRSLLILARFTPRMCASVRRSECAWSSIDTAKRSISCQGRHRARLCSRLRGQLAFMRQNGPGEGLN